MFGCSKRIEPGRVTVPRGSTTDRHILRAGSDAERSGAARRHVSFYRGRDGSGALSDVSNFLLALLKGDLPESVIRDSLLYEKAG